MPLVATVRDSGKLSLDGAVEDSGIGEGIIRQSEDIILARLMSPDSRVSS